MKVLKFVLLLYVVDIIQGGKSVEKSIEAIGKQQSKIEKETLPAGLAGILNANDDCLETILVDGTMQVNMT